MDLRWYVCDLKTGVIRDELPLATSDGKVQRRIANVTTAQFTLATFDKKCPQRWTENLIPGKSMIVLTIDDVPTQGWADIDYTAGAATVPINASTLEECLNRSNVPDLDPEGAVLTGDLADLDYSNVAAAIAAEMPLRFGFLIEAEASGKLFDNGLTYTTTEDRSVLDALNVDIMGADGGPEWRIALRWSDDTHRGFDKVIEIAPRIGSVRPDAIFDLNADGRGSIESYTRTPSYAAGKGATLMIGTSEGSGTNRPVTDPQLSDLVSTNGWPVWETRENFSGLDDAVDEEAELLARTQARLRARQSGTATWSIVGRASGPKPGVDFSEGDTVPVVVAPNPPKDPDGGLASLRTLGWELDVKSGQVDVLLWDDGSETDG